MPIYKKDGTLDRRFSNQNREVKAVRKIINNWHYKTTGLRALFSNNNKSVAEINLRTSPSSISCGVSQLYGVCCIENLYNIGIPEATIEQCIRELIHFSKRGVAFVIASNYIRHTRGNALLDKLCNNKSDYKKNPNSNNMIRVWIL